MSQQFVSSIGEAQQLPGVYVMEVDPPPPTQAPGLDWVGFVGAFAWGPEGPTVVGSTQEYLDTFAPGGQGYSSTGYRALARTVQARLKIVRAIASDAAAASMILQTATPVNIWTVAAKYKGALGGSITLVISAADDGVSSHFNATVTLGTEVEVYRNLSAITGRISTPDITASKILGTFAAVSANAGASTRPVNGTYVLGVTSTNTTSRVAGSDGTMASTDYIGTTGAGDHGIARFEGDPDVTVMCVDDCGSSLRVAVNTALVAHGEAEGRSNIFINGDSGLTPATAMTDIATNASAYRSERATYLANWCWVRNPSGVLELNPPSAFVAGAVAHMPRHLGTHWKDDRNTRYFRGIASLEWNASRANMILMRNVGVEVLVPTQNGSFSPKCGITTSLVAGKTTVARRRLADFIARAAVATQQTYEGGPIDPVTRSEQIGRVNALLQPMKDAAKAGEAATTEVIDDYDVRTLSSPAELASGLHRIGVRVKSFATQDVVLFVLTVGPTVTITETAAAA